MKRNFIMQLSDEDRLALHLVAKAAHLDETKYAAIWVRELARLRPEYALKVLGLIPDEWKQPALKDPKTHVTPPRDR